MRDTYGLRDLVDAQVAMLRMKNAHPDLATSRAAYYAALSQALGVTYLPDRERTGAAGLDGLIRSSLRVLASLASPFADFLEAPPAVVDLHARFGTDISRGLGDTRSAVTALLVAAIAELHDIPLDREATSDDLRRHGFDPSTPWPDELDYW